MSLKREDHCWFSCCEGTRNCCCDDRDYMYTPDHGDQLHHSSLYNANAHGTGYTDGHYVEMHGETKVLLYLKYK